MFRLADVTGPVVHVYLLSDPSIKYRLSKELLYTNSGFFNACFNNSHFIEVNNQEVYLDAEIERIPFELLIRFLYFGIEGVQASFPTPSFFRIAMNPTEKRYIYELLEVPERMSSNSTSYTRD